MENSAARQRRGRSVNRESAQKQQQNSPPPPSPSPTRPSTARRFIKALVVTLLLSCSLSVLLTDTLFWRHDPVRYVCTKLWPKPAPVRGTAVFTVEELAQHDGKDQDKPIYLAINGDVFDVTEGREYYGPGGGYSFFAGRDASRAYVTGCFKDHLTHDTRGLTDAEIESLKGWADFYMSGGKYKHVGRVLLPPIPADAPIPPDCRSDEEKPPI